MAHYTTLLLSTLLVGTALAQRGSHHHHHHTKCMGPKDCLYPNPDSCTTYIQCVPLDEVGNAKPVVKPCPKGLQWNDNVGKKWCDYPNLSTCPVTTTRAPTTTTKSAPTVTTTTRAPTTTTPATKCMGPKDCLYPNPDSCTTYIQCVPLDEVGNAKPVVKPCPKGLQWNDNVGKKWCDYPNLSTCPVEAAAKEAAAKEAAAKEAAAKAMWKDVLKKIGTVALHAGKAALGAVADTISQ
nr:antimicrobial protein CBD2-DrsB1 [synthetic construct]